MLIDTPTGFEETVQLLNAEADPVAWDLETTGKDWRRNKICGVGLHVRRGETDHAFYLPFRHREGKNLPIELLARLWREVLHPNRLQLFWHGSFDVKVAAHHDGYRLPHPDKFQDGILAALLVNENEPSFKMEALMTKYIDKNAAAQSEALEDYLHERYGGSRKKVKGHIWKAPPEIVGPYGCQDVRSTRDLRDLYLQPLKDRKVFNLWLEMNEFQMDICRMELRGIKMNRAKLPMLYIQAEEKSAELKKKIEESIGHACNPNSPKQMGMWLGVKSTAAAVLKRMKDPRADLLLEYRQWAKAISTYYEPYTRSMDEFGILRCNLHITSPGTLTRGKDDSRNGTVAGRLSSSDPNLQQVPRGSESYRVKELFQARRGYKLAELDYSQAELRIAAHFSKDERLTDYLLRGVDMHDAVAEEMGVPRHIAKNINFSAWYGIGYRTFARNYYISEAEAREYLDKYHRLFPGIRRLYNACEAQAAQRGYIRLYTGRRRNYNCKESPTYKASNNLIQGTVAEMIRRAITKTAKEVPEARQVLMVHDSIWYEVPTATAEPTIEKLRAIMQDQPFRLPMIVDAKVGASLAEARDLPRSTAGIPRDVLASVRDWRGVFGFDENAVMRRAPGL